MKYNTIGMNLEYKGCEYKVEDLTKGSVRFVASVAGNIDHGGDLISSGKAYEKTVNSPDDKLRVKHFREHNDWAWVGFPTLSIEGNKLIADSKLMLKRDIGLDTYELYKAAAETGRLVEHSIGYMVDDSHYDTQEGKDIRIIDSLTIREVSTLSAWGMNNLAVEFDVKSMDFQKLLVEEKYLKQLLNAKFDDVKLEGLEQLKNKIEKELIKRQPQEKSMWEILTSQL